MSSNNKPAHYEEAQDFDEVVDWEKVYAMDRWNREAILRGTKEAPKKKVCQKKSTKSTNFTED